MPTLSKTNKDGSVTWDVESIFDPPQHNFKSEANASGIAPSNNPLFTPLQALDDDDDDDEAKQGDHDVLSFKTSLSKDMDECDDSFSEYLGMGDHGNIPFPSPLQELNDKDQGQIMNEALGMSFDFNENPAMMDMSASPDGPRCSLSTPPRR